MNKKHRYFAGVSFILLATVLDVNAETIRIGGTGAALGTMKQLGQAFEKLHPEHVVVQVPSLGSSGGIRALQAGALQMAVSGRDLKLEEQASGLTATRYGSTAFVFAAHPGVPLSAVTQVVAADLYSGKQAAWTNGRPVRLILRPKSEGDTILLRSIAPGIDAAVSEAFERPGMVIGITDTESADQIENYADSFGTSSLALILSEQRKLKILPFDGKVPSVASLESGAYPFVKHLYAVLPKVPTPGTLEFVKFIDSAASRKLLRELGHKTYSVK